MGLFGSSIRSWEDFSESLQDAPFDKAKAELFDKYGVKALNEAYLSGKIVAALSSLGEFHSIPYMDLDGAIGACLVGFFDSDRKITAVFQEGCSDATWEKVFDFVLAAYFQKRGYVPLNLRHFLLNLLPLNWNTGIELELCKLVIQGNEPDLCNYLDPTIALGVLGRYLFGVPWQRWADFDLLSNLKHPDKQRARVAEAFCLIAYKQGLLCRKPEVPPGESS